MERHIDFTARGHKNVLATHRTTIEITKDSDLTPAGDCIVCVGATMGFMDLPEDFKDCLRKGNIRVTIECKGVSWSFSGKGTCGLKMENPDEMVMRKSGYECNRTLMVHADAAACDMPKDLVTHLQDPEAKVNVRIEVTGRQDSIPLHRSTRT